MIPATLADYVPRLRDTDDDIWRMRIVCHEFGLRWEDTPQHRRRDLVEAEPGPISPPWDAFLAAYVEYRCYHDGLTTPGWVFCEHRYLDGFWFPFPPRVEGIPGRSHGACPRSVRNARHPDRRAGPDGCLMSVMGRPELVAVLRELAELLRIRTTTARIYIVGGAAMALAYDSDRFTHDIDALILDNHTTVTQAVHDIARRRGLPTSWLNEQASAYMPPGDDPRSRVVSRTSL